MSPATPSQSGGHAPLLWLVIAMVWGGVLAEKLGAAVNPLTLILLGLVLALAALVLTRSERSYSPAAWGFLLIVAGTLLTWAYVLVRQPAEIQDKPFLPREAELVLRIERTFQTNPARPHISGFATVREAPAVLKSIEGQYLAYSLYTELPREDILPGSLIRARARLDWLDPAKVENDFERYLVQSGAKLRFDRGDCLALAQPAPAFRRWCSGANLAISEALHTGANTPQSDGLADIATAMLLGKKGELSGTQKDAFIASGTMHLFAVSGLHVGIIALSLAIALRLLRLPAGLTALLGLALLFFYVQIIGATPSAVRAYLMVLCFWGAQVVKRKPAPLSALLGSAVLVLLWEPRQLFSPGFQLSYTVVAAILLYAVPLTEYIESRTHLFRLIPEENLSPRQRLLQKGQTWLIGSAAVSWAAFVFSTPLTIAYFKIFAPGAILLNLVLVPLAMLAIVSSLVAVASGLIGLSLLQLAYNYAGWMLILLMWQAIVFLGQLSVLFWQASFIAPWLAPVCTLLLLMCLLVVSTCWRRKPLIFFLPLAVLIPVLVMGVNFTQA